MLSQIKKVTKSNLVSKPVPTVTQIHANKFSNITSEIDGIIEKNDYSNFANSAQELCEKYSPVDIIAALMKNQFDKELSFDYEHDALKSPVRDDVRLFLSVGRRDGLTPKILLKYVDDNARVRGTAIRNIDIMENFSFMNVDKNAVDKIMNKCIGGKINKRKVNIEISSNTKKKGGRRNSR